MKTLFEYEFQCVACMEVHKIKRVKVKEWNILKGVRVEYYAVHDYCSNTDCYCDGSYLMNLNHKSMFDAYSRKANK